MTDIDLKRLAVDREYWDECGAPEDATHVGNRWDKQPERGFKPCWYRLGEGAYFYYPENRQWEPCANGEPSHTPTIPRPTKQEWDGKGLPPVGMECRMTLGFGEYDRVKISYMGDGVFCYLNMRTKLEYTGALCDATFRPLKSKRECQREELAQVIRESDDLAYSFRPDDIADAILSKYNLEPKP